jgi:hypothetical protein
MAERAFDSVALSWRKQAGFIQSTENKPCSNLALSLRAPVICSCAYNFGVHTCRLAKKREGGSKASSPVPMLSSGVSCRWDPKFRERSQ